MTLEEYRQIHDDRYNRNGDYSFIEWANRRVTTLTMLDCALRSEQFNRLRKSDDFDFTTFANNQYKGNHLPVAVVSYQKVKPRGGANAEDPDETFRSFITCSCDQAKGHCQLSHSFKSLRVPRGARCESNLLRSARAVTDTVRSRRRARVQIQLCQDPEQ